MEPQSCSAGLKAEIGESLALDSSTRRDANAGAHPPWGLSGGKGGAVARTFRITGAGLEEMPSKFIATFRRGDVLRAEMPGSGRFGDPLERDPGAVREDVRQEKVSIAHALASYGVVIEPDTHEVDLTATREARRNARAARDNAPAAP